jgi:hypothetical protein
MASEKLLNLVLHVPIRYLDLGFQQQLGRGRLCTIYAGQRLYLRTFDNNFEGRRNVQNIEAPLVPPRTSLMKPGIFLCFRTDMGYQAAK